MALAPFIWGRAGTRRTPEEIARDRELAAAQMRAGMDYSPVGHWTQGLSRVADALIGGSTMRDIQRAEEQNRAESQELIANLLSGLGGDAPSVDAPAPAYAPAVGVEYPAEGVAEALLSGSTFEELAPQVSARLQRDFGLSPAQAAGVVGNLAYESAGLQAINEFNPMVPGSRGGFGWAQWTGPRREAFEKFAANNGMDVADPNTQYAFLSEELRGPEGRVLDDLRTANDATTAGRIFSEKFLRPGIANNDQRNKWIASVEELLSRQPEQDVAQPEVAVEEALVAPASVPAPAVNVAPQISQQLIAALTNPYLDPQSRQIATAIFEQQLQRGDPLYQAQVQKAVADARAASDPNAALPDSVRALEYRARAAGLTPGTDAYRQFMATGGRSESENAREQQIARLQSDILFTGAARTEAEARSKAIGIVDGRLRADRHPLTGELQIVDMATGRPIYGGQRAPQGEQAGQPQSPAPNSEFGTPFEAGGEAFGLKGAAVGALNKVADALGLAPIDEKVMRSQADYSLLGENLLNDIASAYSRQPPSWLLKEIRTLIPSPGNPLVGAGAAKSQMQTIGRHLSNELNTTTQALNSRQLSPEMRQQLETRQMGLEYALARLRSAVDAIERTVGPRQADNSQPAGKIPPPPAGVDANEWPTLWQNMTPEERKLWQN